jgi:hypothetical protein
MNPVDENMPISDDDCFDLLVDGELSEEKRRELLSRLDDEPTGWRRCALAFLQAQSWREACGKMAGGSSGEPPPRRRTRWYVPSGPVGTLAAMAASFLVALLLGWQFQGIWRTGGPGGLPDIGAVALEGTPETLSAQPVAPDIEQPRPPEPSDSPPTGVYLVELASGEGPGGQRQTIRLPAVEQDQLSADWLESLPAPISAGLLEQLEQAGLRVEQRRGVLPLRTRDGRMLLVPVDDVDIHYEGNPTF